MDCWRPLPSLLAAAAGRLLAREEFFRHSRKLGAVWPGARRPLSVGEPVDTVRLHSRDVGRHFAGCRILSFPETLSLLPGRKAKGTRRNPRRGFRLLCGCPPDAYSRRRLFLEKLLRSGRGT